MNLLIQYYVSTILKNVLRIIWETLAWRVSCLEASRRWLTWKLWKNVIILENTKDDSCRNYFRKLATRALSKSCTYTTSSFPTIYFSYSFCIFVLPHASWLLGLSRARGAPWGFPHVERWFTRQLARWRRLLRVCCHLCSPAYSRHCFNLFSFLTTLYL